MTLAPPDTDLLEVLRTGASSWRALDTRLADGDPRRIVAELQRIDGYVMVHWRGAGAGWAAFPHLPAALRAVRLTCAGRRQVALTA
ncbi:MAG: hypothetical protein JWP66_1085 [Naasia sp.]|nr:hypothetical protein [Naasia sp.]